LAAPARFATKPKIRREAHAMLDLTLAIAHHLLVFTLYGIVFAEFFALRQSLGGHALARLARLDLVYGLNAGLIIVVGFSRAIFAAKGWHYYAHNGFFWAKIGTFALIGLASIPPTLAYLRWRKAGAEPSALEIKRVRFYLHLELGLFVPLLGFAAAMARGYGEF
jgi:putative membrane protein